MSTNFYSIASQYVWRGKDSFEELNNEDHERLVSAAIDDMTDDGDAYNLLEDLNEKHPGLNKLFLKACLNLKSAIELIEYLHSNEKSLSSVIHKSYLRDSLADKYDDVVSIESSEYENWCKACQSGREY